MVKINYIIGFAWLMLALSCTKQELSPLLPAPEVTEVNPSSAFIGDTVIVSGRGFLAEPTANVVTFGGKAGIVISVVGDSDLKTIVPNGALSGNVVVGNANASTKGPAFTVLANPNPPTISSLSSQDLEVGEVIEIIGTHFIAKVDTSANQVQIGGKRLRVVSATSTRLLAVVPSGAVGANQDLAIGVKGATSNAIKVTVKGFAGSLFWTLLPTENKPDDKIRQLIAQLKADGSTLLNDRLSVAIPDDSAENKIILKFSLAGPKTFNQKTDQLYYARTDRDTLWQLAAPAFTGFQKVLSADEAGAPLNAVTALAAREDNSDLFFAYDGIINQGKEFFGFVPSGSVIEQMVTSQNALYLLVRDQAGVSTLQTLAYTAKGEPTQLVNTSTLPTPATDAKGIASILYSLRAKTLYLVFQESITAIKLYKLAEGDATPKLVVDNLPYLDQFIEPKFTLLDAATGPKLYGVGVVNLSYNPVAPELVQVLYMINLKTNPTGNYQATTLYTDLLKLPGREETFQYKATGSNVLPFTKVDFLFASER